MVDLKLVPVQIIHKLVPVQIIHKCKAITSLKKTHYDRRSRPTASITICTALADIRV